MPLETEGIDTNQTNPPPTTPTPNPYVNFYFEPIQTNPKEGDVIIFTYMKRLFYDIHDKTPLVLVLNSSKYKGYIPGQSIRGINLHYLTYNTMSQVIEMAHKGMAQSYEQVKAYQMCSDAFRHYLWNWIAPGSIKKMNTVAIQAEVNTIKKYGKMSQEDLRKIVQQQLEQRTGQPKAVDITKPIGTIKPMPAIGSPTLERNTLNNNMETAMPI